MGEPLLVCAAASYELTGLRVPSGLAVASRAIGVGPVEAALGAAEALSSKPRGAVLVGTCGAYPGSGLAVGDVVVVERAVLSSAEAAAGLGYVPPPAAVEARAHPALLRAFAPSGRRAVACATVLAITSDAAMARLLAERSGCAVEHMEAHAFLRAAARAGVPAICVFGVANVVGPEAHAQWKAHGAEAAAAALAALSPLLAGLAGKAP